MQWYRLSVLLIVAAPLEAQDGTLRLVGERGSLNAAVVTDRGHPAYAVTLLEALGARIVDRERHVTVFLFGDSLLFYPTWPHFVTRGRFEPLPDPAYRDGGVLYLPDRFFTVWLPTRYPDRLSYRAGTLSLLGGATAMTPEPALTGSISDDGNANIGAHRANDQEADDVSSTPVFAGLVSFDGRLSSVFDSNIDHDAVPDASIGSIARMDLGLQSSRSDPIVQLEYELGVYRFTNTERWNRITHDVVVELEPPLSGPIRPAFEGELRFGSTTEDRERADQFILEPEVELRLSRVNRLTLYGAQRVRRFTDRPDRDAINRFLGLEFRHYWSSGARWELDGRYEVNDAERERSRYIRWTGEATMRVPLTAQSRLRFGIRYRFRRYGERFVELDGEEEQVRVDRRWEPEVSLSYWLPGDVVQFRLEYEFEHNQSNELDEAYRAHRMEFMVRRRF